MNQRLRLLLWGLGKDYNRYLNLLKYWESQREIEIIGVTDKNIPELLKIDEWRVYKTEDLPRKNIDYYLVMSDNFFCEIFGDIVNLGIDKGKILPAKILSIPYFDWNKYLTIKKSNLSIICNNCVGGIIYNSLGLECKSPCKNLAIPDKSFLKLVSCLEYYMHLDIEFKRWQTDPHSKKMFPVMKLNDIEIWCNHDELIGTAIDNWERRRKKVNYKNILMIMYTESDEIGEEFLNKTNYNKLLFVPEGSRLDGEHVFKLKLLPGQKEFWEVVNSSASLGKNGYSYKILDILNGEKKYRYLREEMS